MVYYDTYGRTFFRENSLDDPTFKEDLEQNGQNGEAEEEENLLACNLVAPGRISESPFDISEIFKNREPFKDHIAKMLQVPVEPTYTNFQRWRSNVQPI